MRKFDTIILHASATSPDWMAGKDVFAKRKEIDRWHRARGFNSIGYHYVIDRDGKVANGRPITHTGAHVKGHNKGSVGICLIGGRWPHGAWGEATDDFFAHFTPEQDKAVRDLITDLCEKYPAIQHIKGHNDYTSAKGCPCFKVSEWLTGGRTQPREVYPAPTHPRAPVASPRPAQRPSGGLAAMFRAFLSIFRGNA